MRRMIWFFAICLLLGVSCGCAEKVNELAPTPDTPTTSARIRVADVTNGTKELFDVDVIGLLWTGFNESLNRRGLLYMGDPGREQYKLEATIVKYQKGSMWLRPVLPKWGKTLLVVKCDLKDANNHVLATVESSHSISLGDGTFTKGAWRKVFTDVTEDVISRLSKKM
ncbi:MAG: hypothetical protein ABFD98_07115 [Syntrophobacteraceae bacterium]|nr:hypothetical protein [Desulfobacteraceae bacterium]